MPVVLLALWVAATLAILLGIAYVLIWKKPEPRDFKASIGPISIITLIALILSFIAKFWSTLFH